MDIKVPQWIRDLHINHLSVTAEIVPDGSSEYCSNSRLNSCARKDRRKDLVTLWLEDFDRSVKLGIPAGKRGTVGFSLTIEYKGTHKPRYSSEVLQGSVNDRVNLPFQCTPEGDFTFERKTGTIFGRRPDRALSVEIEVYPKRENIADTPLPGVPESVWKEWMKQLRTLKIVMIARLTMTQGGPGLASVTIKDESASIPQVVAGSTGERTAVLGPMTIELEPIEVAPPITAEQGLLYHAYFGIDSSELDKVVKGRGGEAKHQGNALATWVRQSLHSRWDVMQALYWKKLLLHVEARASATAKGLRGAELLRYNQELSEKRLDAVTTRLKKTIAEKDQHIVLDTTQMKAIGASKAAKLGAEDDLERRCVISIDAEDLKKAIKEMYGRDFGGTSPKEFADRLP
jgi:hypothetical protein